MRSIDDIKESIKKIRGDETERRRVQRDKVGALKLPVRHCAICHAENIKLFPVYLRDSQGMFSTEKSVCLTCYAANAGTKLKRR